MVSQAPAAPEAPLQPEVISAYSWAWKKLWKSFWMLLLVWIIFAAISGVLSWIPFLNYIAAVFFTNPLNYGVSYVFLKAARGQSVVIGDLFSIFKNYLQVFLASLLTMLIVGVGFILLIIPGIFLACKMAFVPFLVMDKKMEATKAIQASWNMTKGYGWQVFLIYLLGVPVIIGGLICLVIGVIPAMMWINLSLASLYHAVDITNPTPAAPPAAA